MKTNEKAKKGGKEINESAKGEREDWVGEGVRGWRAGFVRQVPRREGGRPAFPI